MTRKPIRLEYVVLLLHLKSVKAITFETAIELEELRIKRSAISIGYYLTKLD